jgi:hypothetical protein
MRDRHPKWALIDRARLRPIDLCEPTIGAANLQKILRMLRGLRLLKQFKQSAKFRISSSAHR